ncbi:MAG TPA: toll/interleukin-1 receptor domain-containing protein [Planctomycetaceae bacterium]|nr:toll/interleukin-1 receptor domain-containing protein [Planctomycetaceae bacterium]
MGAANGPVYDVFLSHSSKDKQWADAACAVLEKHRVRCWIAPRDILPGDEWGAAIVKGIHASRMMVLIFSGNANASAQVRREVERAISRGQTVLPLRIENVPPDGALEYALSNTHWLDAFTPPVENQLTRLAQSVRALLDAAPAAAAQTSAETTAMLGQTAALPVPTPRRSFGTREIALALGVIMIVAVGLIMWMKSGEQPTTASATDTTSESHAGAAPPTANRADLGEPIDVLARLGSTNRKKAASWELRNHVLSSAGRADEPQGLPVNVPEEYQLEVSVSRARPGLKGEFTVGLVCGEHRVELVIDGWLGTISGLSLIDGKPANENESKYEGHLFDRGRPVDIVVTVRKGAVHVTADGMTIVDWKGDFSRLSSRRGGTSGLRGLGINSYGGYFRIVKLTLTPIQSAD